MPGGSNEHVDKTTTDNTQPWLPTIPGLEGIISKLGGMSTDVSPGQTTALGNLTGALSGLGNYGGMAGNLAGKLFGSNTDASKGILSGAYSGLKDTLSPYLSSSYLNPMSTPGLSDALAGMKNDITNSVSGQFSAAGRDMSPAYSRSLSEGLTRGMAPIITDQYNKNVGTQMGAAGNLFGAGASTASGLTGLDQTAIGNWLSGMGVAGQIPGLTAAPGMAQLGAATQAGQTPFQNLSWLTSGLMPIAALGSQGTSHTQGDVTKATDPMSNIIGGVLGGAGIVGGTGGFGPTGWLTTMMSDERLKENIHKVGALYDGQPIYSYNYRWDVVPRIGLMAQDVEKTNPAAVVDVGGFKAVDYGKATQKARELGMLAKDGVMS